MSGSPKAHLKLRLKRLYSPSRMKLDLAEKKTVATNLGSTYVVIRRRLTSIPVWSLVYDAPGITKYELLHETSYILSYQPHYKP